MTSLVPPGTSGVVVTGGGQGLGRAFAHDLAARGWSVAVVDVNGEAADRVQAEIVAIGGSARSFAIDISDEIAVAKLAIELSEWDADVVGLVNNAAIFSSLQMGGFEGIDSETWNKVMSVNVTGAFFMCRAIVPLMRTRGYGKIVNISSATILTGRSGYLHYVTSKAALVGLTRALASEIGPDGIRVNAITPGSTHTEIVRSTVTADQRDSMAKATALRRIQLPRDVVGSVAFLLAPDSDFITGQTLNVDGGLAFH